MKRILGVSVAMVLSLVLACGAMAIGFYHLEVARAEEALATFDATLADGIYARLGKTLGMGRHIPWILDGARADLQVRRSRLSYWRRDYAAVLGETAAVGENEKAFSPSLRFIRANARYRAIAAERSREQVIKDLGESIRDYAKTVDADPMFADAAFNYEYLVMLREDIAGGKRPAPSGQQGAQSPLDAMKGVHGEQGAEQAFKTPQRMKVLVPKEGDEPPEKRGPQPGKGSAVKKRG